MKTVNRGWKSLTLSVSVVLAACSPGSTTGQTLETDPTTTTTGSTSTTSTPGSDTTTPPPTTPTTEREDPWHEIVVTGGQPVGGVLRVDVSVGDEVRLRVTSDTAGHVHIHGYELMFEVGGGVPVEYSFIADVFGIFEIELEATHVPIADLVVR